MAGDEAVLIDVYVTHSSAVGDGDGDGVFGFIFQVEGKDGAGRGGAGKRNGVGAVRGV